MYGMDLDKPIVCNWGSLRIFDKNERHITRVCQADVLLLVYEGVLRFSENGVQHEVSAGEYYIQKRGAVQGGEIPSDAPKYLYIHFVGEWSNSAKNILPQRGNFDYAQQAQLINEIDRIWHSDYSYTARQGKSLNIFSRLYEMKDREESLGGLICAYIEKHLLDINSLEGICAQFHYSKNHVINVFRREYGITPFEYINDVKIKRAMYLLEVTSRSIEDIAIESGFNHYSHFYRLFIRKNGISPHQWRKNARPLG